MSAGVKADGGGLRYNEGKPPMELVPPEAIFSIARVLAHGASKYAKRNWERGMARSTCYACAMRHLLKWMTGEDLDSESGLSHLEHALTNLAFLVTYEQRGIGEDDRPQVMDLRKEHAMEQTYTIVDKDGVARPCTKEEFDEACKRILVELYGPDGKPEELKEQN